jgi:hypothetical protein
MSETKTQIQMQGPNGPVNVEAYDVTIDEITERPVDIRLSDGSVINVRCIVTKIFRLHGQYDKDGKPMYVGTIQNNLNLVDSPRKLNRPIILLPNSANGNATKWT